MLLHTNVTLYGSCQCVMSMSVRTKHKTVKSEEAKSIFGRIKGIFKSSETLEKATLQRREYNQTTEEQIKKMFRLHKAHPKLCYGDIAKSCGVKEPVVHYWLEQKEQEVLANFKVKKGRKLHEAQKKQRIVSEKKTKSKKKAKQTQEQQERPTEQAPQTESEANQKLDELYSKEKYPVEHQADPRYFHPTNPAQAVATEVAFKDQKRRNNINRVNTAKLLQSKVKVEKEDKRKDRLEKKHKDSDMKIHFANCPSCNRKSTISVDDYNKLVYDEFKRQRNWSQKQQDQMKREKDLDQREKDALGSVADRAKDGLELCLKCGKSITYSQSSRTSGRLGEGQFYCADHEPKEVL